MNRYRIIVEQITPDDKLVEEDRRSKPAGRYLYAAGDPKQALFRFHQEIPIVRGDDFTVEVEEYRDHG